MSNLPQIEATAVLLTVFGALMAVSVLFSRALDRMGIPVVLLFLVLGMIGGSEGIGGVYFSNYGLAFQIATAALVLILFDGGLNTSSASIRRAATPAGILATVGVVGTAAVMALLGRLLGLSWEEAMLVGAIVSSTDAAAVFAVLRGGRLRVKEGVRSVIELESCLNDPMAVILTVVALEVVRSGTAPTWGMLLEVPLQLAVGAMVGAAVGVSLAWLLQRVRVGTAGLVPVVTIASGFLAFGAATLLSGSGFLAVFVAAAILGNSPLPYRSGLGRVHDAIAWMCQVSMFLMLGLLVYPSQLLSVAVTGLALGLGLAVVARPVVVAACLAPLRWRRREMGYVSWVGIRGAVPIVLATFPVMAGIPGAERIFHIVFFIVVVSAFVPGATILPLTRRLDLVDERPEAPTAALEMHSLRRLHAEIHVYRIDRSVAVCGAPLSAIPFPPDAAVAMVVRGDEVLPARGRTRFEEGDFVYVICRPQDEPAIGLLFGQASGG